MLEATTPPTEPQQLPIFIIYIVYVYHFPLNMEAFVK